jgi:uncharacterized protein YndB with AHSA1/START domain
MSRTRRQYTSQIKGSPETIFDLIADMPGYGRWLSGSRAFASITHVTPYPVRLGTTYLDAGPAGERPGRVTEFDRPRHIGFHHEMLLRKGPLTAHLDARIRYTFEPFQGGTFVTRDLEAAVHVPRLLTIADRLVVSAVHQENARILPDLKRFVEAQPNSA